MIIIDDDLWQAPLQTCCSPKDCRRIAQESRDHIDRMFGIVNVMTGNRNNYSETMQESNSSIETAPINNRDEEVCTIMPYITVLWYI